jgi:DNA-nicking Smr family endonuclease
MAQRLSRGKVAIERRIDLHGSTLGSARPRLLEFLRFAQIQGLRTVLVITGKGDSPLARHTLHGFSHFHSPERQGKLRRSVPEWLGEAEFRMLVSGYQPAHPMHGGGGAFYVRLRRPKGER